MSKRSSVAALFFLSLFFSACAAQTANKAPQHFDDVQALFAPPPLAEISEPKVQILQYSSLDCSHCSVSFEQIAKLVKKYPKKIRYEVRLVSFGPKTAFAERLALAAVASDRYWEALRYLFPKYAALPQSAADLGNAAALLQLNQSKWLTEAQYPEIASALDSNLRAWKLLKATGVPTFIINGDVVHGSQPKLFKWIEEKAKE